MRVSFVVFVLVF